MSFLTLDQKIDPFRECLFSIWFREPVEAIAIAAASPVIGDPDYPEFDKTIPLVVLGGPRVQQKPNDTAPVVGNGLNYSTDGSGNFVVIDGRWEIRSSASGLTGSHYLDPSYIGLDVSDPVRLKLVINLQLDAFPDIENYFFIPDGVTETDTDPLTPFPRGLEDRLFTPSGMQDVSVERLLFGAPENYSISVPLRPTADQWHHVLMSFDLGTNLEMTAVDALSGDPTTFQTAVQKYSKLWLVVDGLSIKMPDVSDDTIIGQPDDALLSFSQQAVATTPYNSTDPVSVNLAKVGFGIPIDPVTGIPIGFSDMRTGSFSELQPPPSYFFGAPVIASGAIGIPAMTRFVDSIYRVEMAEFQLWTGTSRDVRDADVLGLFLTDKGKPSLKAKDVTDALGAPQIKLHGSGNWRNGKNTGEFDSNFTPTGRIKPWKPNPSLTGPQDPVQNETN